MEDYVHESRKHPPDPEAFSDWELLFRLDMAARSLAGLFAPRTVMEVMPAADPLSQGGHRPFESAMQCLSLHSIPDAAQQLGVADVASAIRGALLRSEPGRGLLMPPALQDASERPLCRVLAEAFDALSAHDRVHALKRMLQAPQMVSRLAMLVDTRQAPDGSRERADHLLLQALAIEEGKRPGYG